MNEANTPEGVAPPNPLTEKLRIVHEVAGVPMPEGSVPAEKVLNVSRPIKVVIKDLLVHLEGRQLLFRMGGKVGVIDQESGRFAALSTAAFISWIPQTLGLEVINGWEGTSNVPKLCDLTKAKAEMILESRDFIRSLPEIVGVNQVRLPVVRKGGGLELLPAGYDPEKRIFTRETVSFDVGMTGDVAVEELRSLLRFFEFSDPNRMAVQIAAMLTFFCREMYSGRPPGFLWVSNLEGSGKSVLAKLAIWIVEGKFTNKPVDPQAKDPSRFLAELNSAALSGANFLFLDNLKKGKLYSNDLNAWITEGSRAFLPKYENYDIEVSVRAVTCLTGCGIELDRELARRVLLIDLFPAMGVDERPLPMEARVIDDAFFRDQEIRARLLAALWALVRTWEAEGRPQTDCGVLKSFEGWSAVVPPIVRLAGFGNALAKFEQPDVGDVESKQLKALVESLVTDHGNADEKSVWISSKEVIACARRHDLFAQILGTIEAKVEELEGSRSFRWVADADGYVSDDAKRAQASGHLTQQQSGDWGWLLKRNAIAGRQWTIGEHVWQLGDRRKPSSRGYDLSLIR